MTFTIRIGDGAGPAYAVEVHPYLELISIPITQDSELDFCFACGTRKDIFWNGKANMCIDCDKKKAIARKLKIALIDEGIQLDEFWARVAARIEIYGGEDKNEIS